MPSRTSVSEIWREREVPAADAGRDPPPPCDDDDDEVLEVVVTLLSLELEVDVSWLCLFSSSSKSLVVLAPSCCSLSAEAECFSSSTLSISSLALPATV